MNKIGPVAVVVGVEIMAYLLLLAVVPVLVDFASTANTTMAASSNMSNYPGTAEAVVAIPWALFFVPGGIGIIAIVIILRKP